MLANSLRCSSTKCVSRTRQCTMELYDQLDTMAAAFACIRHNDIAGDEPQSFSMFQTLAVSSVCFALLADCAPTSDDSMLAVGSQHDVKFEAHLRVTHD
jgi:hypothetical protein